MAQAQTEHVPEHGRSDHDREQDQRESQAAAFKEERAGLLPSGSPG